MKTNLSSQITLTRIPLRYYRPENAFEHSVLTRLEKIPTNIYESAEEGSFAIAKEIATQIRKKQDIGKPFVIALPGGRSPLSVYKELIRMHKEEKLSFRNVIAFVEYEFYPLANPSAGNLARLKEELFDQVDIDPANIYCPDGSMPKDAILDFCRQYEETIQSVGGIDCMLLGIGNSSNIMFNVGGTTISSRTRMVLLEGASRKEAARTFPSQENVPAGIITMGISTMMNARSVILMAWGEDKASIVAKTVEGKVSDAVPSSYLQNHPNAKVVIDLSAAYDLTRISHPWLGTNRPERANPYPKKVIVFSPHPDDDVISMGGTLRRLCDQHHDVHVAYETSGNIAVGDEEVIRYCEYLRDVCEKYSPDSAVKDKANEIINYLRYEKVENGEPERKDVLFMKGTIRREEARHGCRYSGVKDDHVHFLDLPFYETGLVKKNDLSEVDKDIVKALLLEIKPDQMFVAGDLADPHGTHKVCLDAVLAAIDEVKDEEWMKNCRVWMYRGAWAEWEMDHIEMAVPISPEELRFKRNAILKHQSQAESAPYLGDDERLFWQRAEDRNRATAELYRQLGLASYEAIEAFVQYIPLR